MRHSQSERITAVGTGGFLIAAYEWLKDQTKGGALDRGERKNRSRADYPHRFGIRFNRLDDFQVQPRSSSSRRRRLGSPPPLLKTALCF